MTLSEKETLDIFLKSEALLEGHFLLTSGKHSNVYFQCAKVLQYPDYTEKICRKISDFFSEYEIDTVIAPAMGGLIVGYEVARQLNKKFIFVEREDKSLTLRRGFSLKEGEKVLVCEDVVTTGGSVFETMEIVKQSGAEVAGVGFIVDRSGGKVQFGTPQISSFSIDAVSFSSDDCELCNKNIPLVKPGSRKIKA